jgi:hypothetical protein
VDWRSFGLDFNGSFTRMSCALTHRLTSPRHA